MIICKCDCICIYYCTIWLNCKKKYYAECSCYHASILGMIPRILPTFKWRRMHVKIIYAEKYTFTYIYNLGKPNYKPSPIYGGLLWGIPLWLGWCLLWPLVSALNPSLPRSLSAISPLYPDRRWLFGFTTLYAYSYTDNSPSVHIRSHYIHIQQSLHICIYGSFPKRRYSQINQIMIQF